MCTHPATQSRHCTLLSLLIRPLNIPKNYLNYLGSTELDAAISVELDAAIFGTSSYQLQHFSNATGRK